MECLSKYINFFLQQCFYQFFFIESFDDANILVQQRRNLASPTYNVRRLLEKPIPIGRPKARQQARPKARQQARPIVVQQSARLLEHPVRPDEKDQFEEEEVELQELSNTVDGDEAAADEHDPLAIDVPVIPNQINESDTNMNGDPDQNVTSNTTQDEQNVLTEFDVANGSGQNLPPTSVNDTQQVHDQVVKAEPVPLLECQSNMAELEQILEHSNENQSADGVVVVEIDEKVTMTFSKKNRRILPYGVNSDELVKYQNDPVSGDLPFSILVS